MDVVWGGVVQLDVFMMDRYWYLVVLVIVVDNVIGSILRPREMTEYRFAGVAVFWFIVRKIKKERKKKGVRWVYTQRITPTYRSVYF